MANILGKKMKFVFYTLFIVLCLVSCNQNKQDNQIEIRFDQHIDSVSYAIGLDLATRIKQDFKDVDIDMLTRGINDYYSESDLHLTDKERLAVIKKYNDITVPKYRMDLEKLNTIEGGKFLDANLKKEGVIEHKSGIQYKIIEQGSGEKPQSTDYVQIHYVGKLIDGTKFDSSYDRGEPAVFPVSRVVPGFSQGLMLMNPGSIYQLFIPGHLGYGQGDGPGGPMAVMIFQVEMLKILPPPEEQPE